MVAAKLANMRVGDNQHKVASIGGTSEKRAAELLNVGERSVERAKKVQAKGDDEPLAPLRAGILAPGQAQNDCKIAEVI